MELHHRPAFDASLNVKQFFRGVALEKMTWPLFQFVVLLPAPKVPRNALGSKTALGTFDITSARLVLRDWVRRCSCLKVYYHSCAVLHRFCPKRP
jgi:hypothetical protein